MHLLRIALPLLFLIACTDAPESRDAFATRDSAGVTIVENVMSAVTASCTLDSTPVLRIGGADESDAQTLYRVMGGSRLSDGRIALVNQGTQEVRWYDSTGVLVGRAGREGRGPGEFQNAFLMNRTRGDTLWVGDYDPWQWHLFGPDMKFARSVVTSPSEVNSPRMLAIFDDGQQIFANSPLEERASWAMEMVSLRRFGADGALIDTLQRIPNGRMGQTVGRPGAIWMRPWFEGSAVFGGRGDQLAVATWNEAELVIYQVGARVTPSRIIRWTTEDRSIPSSAVATAREQLANEYPDLSPDMKAQLVDPLLDAKRPVADRYPAVTAIVMGTDGRIWVRGYAAADASPRPWIAFSSEGRALCRATLPAVEVYEIGRDYMLAHESDSLGVERVVVYRVNGEQR